MMVLPTVPGLHQQSRWDAPPARLAVPAGHAVTTLFRQKKFAGHAVHWDPKMYMPATHTHPVTASVFAVELDPAGQRLAEVDPAGQKKPTGHSTEDAALLQ